MRRHCANVRDPIASILSIMIPAGVVSVLKYDLFSEQRAVARPPMVPPTKNFFWKLVERWETEAKSLQTRNSLEGKIK